MALVDNAWYVNFGNGSSTGYYGLTVWSTGTVTTAGTIRRQLTAPAVGSERVFVCIVAGTTHPTTEPTWVLTRGAKTTDNVVTWQECTGIAALNGDATNTPSWTITATPPGGVKGTAVTLGQVIKRDNGVSYQICTTAGTAGSGAEPSFSDTAGTTTNDNTAVWTSLGVVGNFTGWQAPHTRLENAFGTSWVQAGNKVFIASASAETKAASVTYSPGTAALPVSILSVDAAGAIPPTTLLAGASCTYTGNTAAAFGSSSSNTNMYFYGVTFNHGSGAVSPLITFGTSGGGNNTITFDTCAHTIPATGSGAQYYFGPGSDYGTKLRFINTTFKFGATGQTIVVGGGDTEWRNTPSAIDAAGSIPTTLFTQTNIQSGHLVCRGVDLSALGSGKTIAGQAVNSARQMQFIDCKIGASVTKAASASQRGAVSDFIRCDSSATNYTTERFAYDGSHIVETTIVRTGGASDGTTTVSWKIVNTANSSWLNPFESLPITIWNDSTSAITTLTIYGTTTGGGVPNNDDIWVEVEYLGSALTPQGSFIATTKASVLAASATTNNSSDASTWGGGGAGNGFKIVVPSFTPGMKGPINITVKAAKASSTYYIDPKPVIN